MISEILLIMIIESLLITVYRVWRNDYQHILNDIILLIGIVLLSLTIINLFNSSNLNTIVRLEEYWGLIMNSTAKVMITKSIILMVLNILGLFIYNVELGYILSNIGLNLVFGRLIDLASEVLYIVFSYSQLMYIIYHMIHVIWIIAKAFEPVITLLAPLVIIRGIRPLIVPLIAVGLSLMMIPVYASSQLGYSNANLINLLMLVNRTLNLLNYSNGIHIYVLNSQYALITGSLCGAGFISYGESIMIAGNHGNQSGCLVTLNSTYIAWIKVPAIITVGTEYESVIPVTYINVNPIVNELIINNKVSALWSWVRKPSTWLATSNNYALTLHFNQTIINNSTIVLWAYASKVSVHLDKVGNCSEEVLGINGDVINRELISRFDEFEEYALNYYNSSLIYGMVWLRNESLFNPISPNPPADLRQYLVNITCRGNGTAGGSITIVGSRLSTWGYEGNLIAYTSNLYAYFKSMNNNFHGSLLDKFMVIPSALAWLMYPLSVVGLLEALLVLTGELTPLNTPIMRLTSELRNLVFLISNQSPRSLILSLIRIKQGKGRATDLSSIIKGNYHYSANRQGMRRLLAPYIRQNYLNHLSNHGLFGIYLKSRNNPYLSSLLREASGSRHRPGLISSIKIRHLLARPLGPPELAGNILLGGRWNQWMESREFLMERLIKNEVLIFKLYERGLLSNREAQRRIRYWFFRSIMEYRSRLRLTASGRGALMALTYLTHGHSKDIIPRLLESNNEVKLSRGLRINKSDKLTAFTLLSLAMNPDAKAIVALVKSGILSVDKGKLMELMGLYRELTSPWIINHVKNVVEELQKLKVSAETYRIIMGNVRKILAVQENLIKQYVRLNAGNIRFKYSNLNGSTPLRGLIKAKNISNLAVYLLRDSTNIHSVYMNHLRNLSAGVINIRRRSTLVGIIMEYAFSKGNVDLALISTSLGLHPVTLIKEMLMILDPSTAMNTVRSIIRQSILDEDLKRELTAALTLNPNSIAYRRLYERYLIRMARFYDGSINASDKVWLSGLMNQLDHMVALFADSYIRRNIGSVKFNAALKLSKANAIRSVMKLSIYNETEYSTLLSITRIRRSIRFTGGKYLSSIKRS
ncbi:hypothetical protein [Caldivirga sp. UBA161]|uniref:hypothetical protein n=1 Tax=Caldivirga sp. UBA161 TaxID=1915569 RepID=UPI0025C4EA4E|nr:hypothetical protein [Caldivirga sp. UBA161]